MTQTLIQARTNTRQLLDDMESTDGRWTDAQINTALHRAATAVAQILAQAGWQDIISSTTVALSNGTATVPANDGIHAVFAAFGDGSTSRILPGNGANRSLQGSPTSGSVLVEYYARTEAPAGDGYTVTYAGVDVGDTLVDQFCEYLAASHLKTVEAEPNSLILQGLSTLEAQIRAKYNPGVQVAPAVRWSSIGRNGAFAGTRWYRSGATTLGVYR
jgi:hypothetical protein